MKGSVAIALAWLVVSATGLSGAQDKRSPERHLGGRAATAATNRLAKDVKDETGLLLLRLAHKLHPESETALLTTAVLGRGLTPDPIAASTTDDALADLLVKRAEYLWGKHLSENAKVGPLCLLYLMIAERFRPLDRTILLGQMKLRARGYEGSLDELLKGGLNLEDMFGNPSPPKPLAKPRLEKVDRDIAKYAAVIGTNRVAAEPEDGAGLLWLRLAACLQPENSVALLTLAYLERGKKPAPIKTKVSQEKLISVITSRAGKLLDEGPKAKGARDPLCLLYHKIAERFAPESKPVILGLIKLKLRKLEGELDDLLAKGSAQLVVEPPPPTEAPPKEKAEYVPQYPSKRTRPVGRWREDKGIIVIRKDKTWNHTHRYYGPGAWKKRGRKIVLYWRGEEVFATFDVVEERQMKDSKSGRTLQLLPLPRKMPKGFSPVGLWPFGNRLWTFRKDNTVFSTSHYEKAGLKWRITDDQVIVTNAIHDFYILEVAGNDAMFVPGGSERLERLPPPRQMPKGFSPVGQWSKQGQGVWTLREDQTGFHTSHYKRALRWRVENGQVVVTDYKGVLQVWEVIDAGSVVVRGGQTRLARLPPPRQMPKGFSPVGQWRQGTEIWLIRDDKSGLNTSKYAQTCRWRIEGQQVVVTDIKGVSRIWEVIDDNTVIQRVGVRTERLPPPPKQLPSGFSPIGKWEAPGGAYTFKHDKTFAHTTGRGGRGTWQIESRLLVLTHPTGARQILRPESATSMTALTNGAEFKRSRKR